MRLKTQLILTLATLAITSCAKYNSQGIDQASQNISQSLGCVDMKSQVFDSFYELVDQQHEIPSDDALKQSLEQEILKLQTKQNLTPSDSEKLQLLKAELFKTIDLMLTASKDVTDWKSQLQKIIQYEMQDQSSSEIIQTHSQISNSFDKIKSLSQSLKLSCQTNPSPTDAVPGQPNGQPNSNPITDPNSSLLATNLKTGINRVMATAYQSCRVLELPAMDKNSPDVQGITRLAANHPDGIGGKRVIGDLKALQKTQYYLRSIASESSCLSVRDNPLIYDYGGEPLISKNTLNFFVNAGSGTSVLGVDCSAFVSSAIATAGLRYKPSLPNKAIYTRQSSSQFIDAVRSGFTCFDNVTVTPNQSIKPGDIVGVKGHVVVVDQTGADPFALNLVHSVQQCLTLNYKNFNFDISQSSPSKNGIGINKFKISDYLDESPKMRTAFLKMAEQACLSKFQNKNLKPANKEWGFLRHKGTPECLAPRVSLVGESCSQSCQGG